MRKQPLVVAYGLGRDSTAMLIGMKRKGIRPDAILFADVGAEKQATYDYLPIMQRWLKENDFPPITVVRYVPKFAPYCTLDGNMCQNCTLPGATFGKASCTMKFKVEPQAKWTRKWLPAKEAWAQGIKVVKCIGFECDEEHRLTRANDKAHSGAGLKDAKNYEYRYYLMDWGWDLERCKQVIADAGLPVPLKSACIFCPNQQACEVEDLTPREVARVLRVEVNAEPYNEVVGGLWRSERKCDGRPASITEYVLTNGIEFDNLKDLECDDPMPINPACSKARMGYTFRPPFNETSLACKLIRERLESEARARIENAAHEELFECAI